MFDHACECGKTFVSKSKLNQHSKWHQEIKCDECGKVFKKGNFARHLKVHANSVITCQICAKNFSRTDNLQTHMIKCHEENLEQYKCDICEKTYANRQYLKQHMDMHRGFGCICLAFLHCESLSVCSNRLLERIHSRIGCNCSTFLHCAFLRVPSNRHPQRRHCPAGCIYLNFLHYVFSNVPSNHLPERMHNNIGCMIEPSGSQSRPRSSQLQFRSALSRLP